MINLVNLRNIATVKPEPAEEEKNGDSDKAEEKNGELNAESAKEGAGEDMSNQDKDNGEATSDGDHKDSKTGRQFNSI